MLMTDGRYILTSMGARAREHLAVAVGVRPHDVASMAVVVPDLADLPPSPPGFDRLAVLVVARHDMPGSAGTRCELLTDGSGLTYVMGVDGTPVRVPDAAVPCLREAVSRLAARPLRRP